MRRVALGRMYAAAAAGRPAPVPTVYHPLYSAPVMPAGHRFPMPIFRTIHDRLLRTGVVDASQVHVPRLLGAADVKAVHCPAYVDRFFGGTLSAAEMRRIGLPWSELLVQRTLSELSGTLLAAELALQHGLATSCAGGTHHAHRDFGSGFCIFNDLALTTHSLLARGLVSRVLVVDLDVHQGDGTAAMLASEPRAFTLSVHAEDNFPARKATSSLDVGLPTGTGDEAYLGAVAEALDRSIQGFRPDIILYDAGVDIHAGDALGRLAVSDGGLRRRDLLVLSTAAAAGIPLAGYVGGGYNSDLEALAELHCSLHAAAAECWRLFKLS